MLCGREATKCRGYVGEPLRDVLSIACSPSNTAQVEGHVKPYQDTVL
jgi:hypothetical protein